MAVQFKEFVRPRLRESRGTQEESHPCTATATEVFPIISISEAKGITDDFYRITVWYDDQGEQFEHLDVLRGRSASGVAEDRGTVVETCGRASAALILRISGALSPPRSTHRGGIPFLRRGVPLPIA